MDLKNGEVREMSDSYLLLFIGDLLIFSFQQPIFRDHYRKVGGWETCFCQLFIPYKDGPLHTHILRTWASSKRRRAMGALGAGLDFK